MLETIELKNFRGFKHIKISDFSQITLLTGKNSAGKSSILESIFLMNGYATPDIFERIRTLRGLLPATDISKLYEPLFFNLNSEIPLEIRAKNGEYTFSLSYVKDNSFNYLAAPQNIKSTYITFSNTSIFNPSLKYDASWENAQGKKDIESGHVFINSNGTLAINSDTNYSGFTNSVLQNTYFVRLTGATALNDDELNSWFGNIELAGNKHLVIDSLKIIDPTIVDIKTIVQNRQAQLYLQSTCRTLPIRLSGDGLCKLIYLVLVILQNPNCIILIDEIENGLHYSMQEQFWRVIAEAAKRSHSQIIATTHSYECITYAVQGLSLAGMLDDFCLHRIENNGENAWTTHYSGSLMESAVESYMEVR